MFKIYWNDVEAVFKDEREAIYCVFLNCGTKIKFQKGLNAKKFIIGICDMFQEVLDPIKIETNNEIKKKEILSLLRKLSFFSKGIAQTESKYFDGEKAQQRIFNFLLSLDGLNTLNGFGFSNLHKDKLKGNSEKTSVKLSNYKDSIFQEIK